MALAVFLVEQALQTVAILYFLQPHLLVGVLVEKVVVFQREQAAVLVVELEATQALLVAQETHQLNLLHKETMVVLDQQVAQ